MKKQLNKIALSLATVERSTGIGMKVGKWYINVFTLVLFWHINGILSFVFFSTQKLTVTAQVFTALRTVPLSEGKSYLLY